MTLLDKREDKEKKRTPDEAQTERSNKEQSKNGKEALNRDIKFF